MLHSFSKLPTYFTPLPPISPPPPPPPALSYSPNATLPCLHPLPSRPSHQPQQLPLQPSIHLTIPPQFLTHPPPHLPLFPLSTLALYNLSWSLIPRLQQRRIQLQLPLLAQRFLVGCIEFHFPLCCKRILIYASHRGHFLPLLIRDCLGSGGRVWLFLYGRSLLQVFVYRICSMTMMSVNCSTYY